MGHTKISKNMDFKEVIFADSSRMGQAQSRSQNPSFKFSEDGVHPNREGHWLLARQILEQALGASIAPATNAEGFFKDGGQNDG